MAVTAPTEMELTGESMYDRLQDMVAEYGEVMIRFDSGLEAELHAFNTEFTGEPIIKVKTEGEVHWFDAEKVESCWIHYDFIEG